MLPIVKDEKDKIEGICQISSVLIEEQPNMLTNLLKISAKFLDAQLGVICFVKGEDYHIENVYCELPIEISNKTVYKLQETLCAETVNKNKLIAIPDLGNPKYNQSLAHTLVGINSYVGIPFTLKNQQKGTINFSSTRVNAQGFSTDALTLMTYLHKWVSHYLNKQIDEDKFSAKSEKELYVRNESLAAILEENKQLMQILVHDLKSPLSNIKMLSYLFQDFATDKDSEELLTIFNKSLDYVFHLIDQMETLNNMESHPLSNYIENFDLKEFVESNIKDFASTAESKSIKLNFSFTGRRRLIKTDMNFLKRILYNLISNALKFSPFKTKIEISLSSNATHFELQIKDEGPGISEDDQVKLFEKFVKLANRPTNSESSSGLGLFIVKELLNNIQGQIKVESEVGAGSTFIVTLPFSI